MCVFKVTTTICIDRIISSLLALVNGVLGNKFQNCKLATLSQYYISCNNCYGYYLAIIGYNSNIKSSAGPPNFSIE